MNPSPKLVLILVLIVLAASAVTVRDYWRSREPRVPQPLVQPQPRPADPDAPRGAAGDELARQDLASDSSRAI